MTDIEAMDIFTLAKAVLTLAALIGLLVWFLLERRAQRRYYALDERITSAVATEKRRVAAAALRKRFTPIPPRRTPSSIEGYPRTPPRELFPPFQPLD